METLELKNVIPEFFFKSHWLGLIAEWSWQKSIGKLEKQRNRNAESKKMAMASENYGIRSKDLTYM